MNSSADSPDRPALRTDGQRRIWITGASKGLGRAAALGAAAQGSALLLMARSEEGLRTVRDEALSAGASAVLISAGSVDNCSDVATAADTAAAAWGGLDVLLNSAGISPSMSASLTLPEDEWAAVLETNVNGLFRCCRAAAQLMDPDGGSIVNIASVHAQAGMPRLAAYSASKGAVEALSRTLALEWADRGIRVNVVAPGYFETDMTEGLRASSRHRSQLLERIPLGRFGRADEVFGAFWFLATDQSSYVTGSTVCVDGGWLAQ